MSGIFSQLFASRRSVKHSADRHLLAAVCATINPSSFIIDVGCGSGDLLKELYDVGYSCLGIDGVIPSRAHVPIRKVDLSKPIDKNAFDGVPRQWALCIEVGEHIAQEDESVFLDNLCWLGPMGIMCSWAIPGQRGRGHINCLSPEHVEEKMWGRGYRRDAFHTIVARDIAGKNWNKKLIVFLPTANL